MIKLQDRYLGAINSIGYKYGFQCLQRVNDTYSERGQLFVVSEDDDTLGAVCIVDYHFGGDIEFRVREAERIVNGKSAGWKEFFHDEIVYGDGEAFRLFLGKLTQLLESFAKEREDASS